LITASTPGKLILLGEHAVVYGQPALVAAVDRRLTVRLELLPSSREPHTLEIDLPQVGALTRETWPGLVEYARRARERWNRYAAAPSSRGFAEVRGDDPAHLVKVALGETAAHLASSGIRPALPGLRLSVESDLPIGSGFGSSAALAVATVAAVLALPGVGVESPDPGLVERLALEVERRQHGMPSGVDGATVLHGGAVWAERDLEGRLTTKPLGREELDLESLALFRVFDTGTPLQSTGEVVAAVRERLDGDGALQGVIEEIGDLTRRFRTLLQQVPGAEMLDLVRRVETGLERLGVVPESVQVLIRRIEAEGGAAKISGAGALSSPPGGLGAGSLLVLHPDAQRIRGWSFLQSLEPLDLPLGAEGLRLGR
jgi:mevalonate kinase